jgi:tetraacyldisaccharide 4'-kinase
VDQLGQRFSELQQKCDIILTTEKDMVRLIKFKSELSTLPIYYLPIECSFIEDGKRFDFEILNRLRSVKNSRS